MEKANIWLDRCLNLGWANLLSVIYFKAVWQIWWVFVINSFVWGLDYLQVTTSMLECVGRREWWVRGNRHGFQDLGKIKKLKWMGNLRMDSDGLNIYWLPSHQQHCEKHLWHLYSVLLFASYVSINHSSQSCLSLQITQVSHLRGDSRRAQWKFWVLHWQLLFPLENWQLAKKVRVVFLYFYFHI